MIEAHHLTKDFGPKRAVDDLTFTVRPGLVTGFLGPNGAGKSTTMRLILGLDRPTSGDVTVNGRPYRDHRAPLQEVGALLDAKATHPGRSARAHLRALAATHRIPNSRVDAVIEMAGLQAVANKRIGAFSLGMGQRLGIACALLGDPATLILDEPVNGLDPEGVAWVRSLVKYLAAEGRTVFLSSHLMSEMAQTADHLIVIGKGKLLADSSLDDIIAGVSGTVTAVHSPQAAEIADYFRGYGYDTAVTGPESVTIEGLTPSEVGEYAAGHGWVVHELSSVQRSLEDAYMALTEGNQEFSFQAGFPAPIPIRPATPSLPASASRSPAEAEAGDAALLRPAVRGGNLGPAGTPGWDPIVAPPDPMMTSDAFWRAYATAPAEAANAAGPAAMTALDPAWPSPDDILSTINQAVPPRATFTAPDLSGVPLVIDAEATISSAASALSATEPTNITPTIAAPIAASAYATPPSGVTPPPGVMPSPSVTPSPSVILSAAKDLSATETPAVPPQTTGSDTSSVPTPLLETKSTAPAPAAPGPWSSWLPAPPDAYTPPTGWTPRPVTDTHPTLTAVVLPPGTPPATAPAEPTLPLADAAARAGLGATVAVADTAQPPLPDLVLSPSLALRTGSAQDLSATEPPAAPPPTPALAIPTPSAATPPPAVIPPSSVILSAAKDLSATQTPAAPTQTTVAGPAAPTAPTPLSDFLAGLGLTPTDTPAPAPPEPPTPAPDTTASTPVLADLNDILTAAGLPALPEPQPDRPDILPWSAVATPTTPPPAESAWPSASHGGPAPAQSRIQHLLDEPWTPPITALPALLPTKSELANLPPVSSLPTSLPAASTPATGSGTAAPEPPATGSGTVATERALRATATGPDTVAGPGTHTTAPLTGTAALLSGPAGSPLLLGMPDTGVTPSRPLPPLPTPPHPTPAWPTARPAAERPAPGPDTVAPRAPTPPPPSRHPVTPEDDTAVWSTLIRAQEPPPDPWPETPPPEPAWSDDDLAWDPHATPEEVWEYTHPVAPAAPAALAAPAPAAYGSVPPTAPAPLPVPAPAAPAVPAWGYTREPAPNWRPPEAQPEPRPLPAPAWTPPWQQEPQAPLALPVPQTDFDTIWKKAMATIHPDSPPEPPLPAVTATSTPRPNTWSPSAFQQAQPSAWPGSYDAAWPGTGYGEPRYGEPDYGYAAASAWPVAYDQSRAWPGTPAWSEPASGYSAGYWGQPDPWGQSRPVAALPPSTWGEASQWGYDPHPVRPAWPASSPYAQPAYGPVPAYAPRPASLRPPVPPPGPRLAAQYGDPGYGAAPYQAPLAASGRPVPAAGATRPVQPTSIHAVQPAPLATTVRPRSSNRPSGPPMAPPVKAAEPTWGGWEPAAQARAAQPAPADRGQGPVPGHLTSQGHAPSQGQAPSQGHAVSRLPATGAAPQSAAPPSAAPGYAAGGYAAPAEPGRPSAAPALPAAPAARVAPGGRAAPPARQAGRPQRDPAAGNLPASPVPGGVPGVGAVPATPATGPGRGPARPSQSQGAPTPRPRPGAPAAPSAIGAIGDTGIRGVGDTGVRLVAGAPRPSRPSSANTGLTPRLTFGATPPVAPAPAQPAVTAPPAAPVTSAPYPPRPTTARRPTGQRGLPTPPGQPQPPQPQPQPTPPPRTSGHAAPSSLTPLHPGDPGRYPEPLVPAPPGTIPTSSVVVDVEETGSLTPLLDKLLFDPDVTQSSPARQVMQTGIQTGLQTGLQARLGDTGSITRASIRRMWEKEGDR